LLSGTTVENMWFEEQDGTINLDLDTGTWITHVYFTGTTDGKDWYSPVENNCILVYSAVTSDMGFWYPYTGVTGEYYVADSSGGSPTRKLTFTNGILTSDT